MPHLTVNGAKLWYDIQGEGEPLLLHHGYTASRDNWAPVADRLKSRYQVILMECRGAGDSEHTEAGYNLEQYALDVLGLLDQLGIDKVSYAGHSMGGGIGYILATQHAARLKRLILMAPIPSGGTNGNTEIKPGHRSTALEARLTAKRSGDRAYFRREQLASRFREDVQTDQWIELRIDHLLRVSESHLLEGIKTMQSLNVTEQLANIHIPTLMLAGGVDGLLNANIADYQRMPDASLHVISRAGHDVAVHEPAAVSTAIDHFMTFGPMTAAKLGSAG